MKIEKANVKNLKLLEEKLIKFEETDKYETWVDSRYGRYFTPTEIIGRLKKIKLAVVVMDRNDGITGFGEIWSKKETKDYFELGFLIFPQYTKRGLGYKLAKYLLNYAKKYNLNIKAECEVTNSASQSMLNSLVKDYSVNKVRINKKYDPFTKVYMWDFKN